MCMQEGMCSHLHSHWMRIASTAATDAPASPCLGKVAMSIVFAIVGAVAISISMVVL
jgi:capsular polysaccharide biosynthesis protein